MISEAWRTILRELETGTQPRTGWDELLRRAEVLLIRNGFETPSDVIEGVNLFFARVPWSTLPTPCEEIRVRLLILAGRINQRSGDWRQAESYFEHALKFCGSSTSPRLHAIALMELGEIRRRSGRLDEALSQQDAALALAEQEGLNRERADAHNNLAIAFVEMGRLEQAIEHLDRSLELAEQLTETRLEGHIYNNLGVIACMQGRFREAIGEFTRALVKREAVEDRKGLSETLHNLALAYLDLTDYQTTADCLSRALDVARCNHDRGQETVILTTSVELSMLKQDYQLALSLAERVQVKQRQIGDDPGLAETYRLIGAIHVRLGDHTRARTALEEAVARFSVLNLPLGQAQSLKELGTCLAALGLTQEANHNRLRALDLYRRIGNAEETQKLAGLLSEPNT